MRRVCLLPVILLAGLQQATAAADEFPAYVATAAGVSFDAVQALPKRAPEQRYDYGDSEQQFAELWLPDSGDRHPLVIFIHGGCWLNAFAIDHSAALATALTRAGYAVWNVEYRRVGDAGGGWPGSFEDIRSALELLAARKPPGLDLQRAVIAGHSAGGHLALLAGSSILADPVAGLEVRGIVGLAPITDIERYSGGEGSCQAAAIEFMGSEPPQQPAAWREANPAVLPLHPHTALMFGTGDRIIPPEQARLGAWHIHWEPAGHFDWIYPGTPAWRVLLDRLETMLQ